MSPCQLYCFAESGNSYKAALMLALSGASWEPIWVDYFGGETKQPAFRTQVSAMGEVPVLVHAGERIAQSGVILDYLAEQTGRFGAQDARERREIWGWLLFDNHKFTSYFATLRFMLGIQNAGESPVTEFLRARVNTAFGIVEQRLTGSAFVAGERPTIADLSMVAYLYYPERTGVDLDAFPRIRDWMQRIAALPGWKAPYELMPRGPARAARG